MMQKKKKKPEKLKAEKPEKIGPYFLCEICKRIRPISLRRVVAVFFPEKKDPVDCVACLPCLRTENTEPVIIDMDPKEIKRRRSWPWGSDD